MNEPFLYAGQPRIPPPSMQIRTRKEASTKDTVNARFFEQWQTDAPSLMSDRVDLSGAKVLLDMNPISSRNATLDYRQSQPFVATGPQLGMNPYFDRYDPVAESEKYRFANCETQSMKISRVSAGLLRPGVSWRGDSHLDGSQRGL
jgi:hypothetical protein